MTEKFAVRRINTELTEQLRNPSLYFVANPFKDDLFDWHFTLKGPEDTAFQGGLYHGRLILPLEYPLKPPKFIMFTPNGRFETMREICVSMSSFHPSDWQPAWTIRTMLEALVSFFPEDSSEGVAAIRTSSTQRKTLAEESQEAYCEMCSATNREMWAAHEASLKDKPSLEETKEPLPHLTFKYSPPQSADKAKEEEFPFQPDDIQSEPVEEAPLIQEEAEQPQEQREEPNLDQFSHLPSKQEVINFRASMKTQLWGLDIVIVSLIVLIVWMTVRA
mmetsp:Transcript_10747/g.20998  ORF Transcript_10747/g.20998 Transcript_10747/m.20998 type:complete len:276 (-) Transcript_10747:1067-1894(-)|eukprot:CAMPEP_0204896584 /NCGR_PEP_ID=MMETSP1397-20131031/248_1 /ASSEMBLY_ACC=CAM_ASM_000891 /TAXON_ID=49980 /ORGANISM="Climacostomum Climacostomum virens, Strain Stock W-24" /LENGTH=275 /DNA_ID=CAMNT_0052064215 /DNA_START=1624 /DNA_END=2451 /DNA_ORIENTATION=-